jgi:hypothetical protein
MIVSLAMARYSCRLVGRRSGVRAAGARRCARSRKAICRLRRPVLSNVTWARGSMTFAGLVTDGAGSGQRFLCAGDLAFCGGIGFALFAAARMAGRRASRHSLRGQRRARSQQEASRWRLVPRYRRYTSRRRPQLTPRSKPDTQEEPVKVSILSISHWPC